MNRQALIQDALGLGPRWQARAGWFSEHPAMPVLEAEAISVEADNTLEAAPTLALEHSSPLQQEQQEQIISSPGEIQPISQLMPKLSQASPSPAASWEELASQVSQCQQCRLSRTRSHTVFGRGNPQARLLLIGEAPGEQEDAQGLPFVGRAGQLLDNMLSAIELDAAQDVYIVNILKCRPPGNRNPQPDEILACQSYLSQQIQYIKPTLILALGRFAAHTLLQTEQAISRLRGQLHQYQGIPLIVSYHPAYLLRNQPDKAKAWQDLLLVRQQLAG